MGSKVKVAGESRQESTTYKYMTNSQVSQRSQRMVSFKESIPEAQSAAEQTLSPRSDQHCKFSILNFSHYLGSILIERDDPTTEVFSWGSDRYG